jgi:hypothetical protein
MVFDSRFRPIVALAFAVAAAFATAAPADVGGPTILTIAGEISKPNRGPFEKFKDGLIASHNKTFAKAAAFSRADLEGLVQLEISAKAESWSNPVKLRGPKLADVLAAAGAEGRTIKLYAVDQYMVEITPEELRANTWVLALYADGEPLGLGGRGPLWLAFDVTGRAPANDDEEAKWAWAIYYIEVQ